MAKRRLFVYTWNTTGEIPDDSIRGVSLSTAKAKANFQRLINDKVWIWRAEFVGPYIDLEWEKTNL